MCTSVISKNDTPSRSMFAAAKKLFADFLRCLIVQLHWLFDCVVDIFFGLYYNHKAKRVPPVTDPLLLDSAIVLTEKIRTKQVSSEEVVKAFIKRCKEVNGLLNAIVEERYNDAIEEAKAVDKLIESTVDIDVLKKTKPYLGVPFTTKESNEAEGLLHSMGSLSRKGYRSKEDATTVGYVKDAGGIIIAKTNIPELNQWVESRNMVYGQTNNPYNTTRTVGGSSGGEAAIIAACGSAISIGSDIGGSTRIPAFCNGVFGHKPSEGITSLKGIGLRNDYCSNSMAEVGPICKKAEDLAPFLKVLAGDKISKLKLDAPVDVRKLNVFYQEGSGDIRASKISKTMRATLRKAVKHFKDLTGSATKIKIPGSEFSFKLWRYWMTQEGADFKSDITNKQYRASARSEFYKLISGSSEITLAALLKLIDEDLFPKENADWAKSLTADAQKYLTDKLGDNGILFYPSAPFPAMYHYSSFLRPYNFGYFCLFNVLKFPVCQVPLGLDKEGLPVGVQVVAAPYNDHLCIAVAQELEKVFGGWVPPSKSA